MWGERGEGEEQPGATRRKKESEWTSSKKTINREEKEKKEKEKDWTGLGGEAEREEEKRGEKSWSVSGKLTAPE